MGRGAVRGIKSQEGSYDGAVVNGLQRLLLDGARADRQNHYQTNRSCLKSHPTRSLCENESTSSSSQSSTLRGTNSIEADGTGELLLQYLNSPSPCPSTMPNPFSQSGSRFSLSGTKQHRDLPADAQINNGHRAQPSVRPRPPLPLSRRISQYRHILAAPPGPR